MRQEAAKTTRATLGLIVGEEVGKNPTKGREVSMPTERRTISNSRIEQPRYQMLMHHVAISHLCEKKNHRSRGFFLRLLNVEMMS